MPAARTLHSRPARYSPLTLDTRTVAHIVEVDVHAASQARQQLEEQRIEFPARLEHVARIDEEDVVCPQAREEFGIDGVHGLADQLDLALVSIMQRREEPAWIRLDEGAGDAVREVALVGIQDDARRVARPNAKRAGPAVDAG